MTLAVITYLWGEASETRYNRERAYTADDVRILQRMVERHLSLPHEFVVVTDHPEAFADDSKIRAVPIDWSKHVPGTCFVRLMTFHPDGRRIFGAERVFQMDLDTVVVGGMDAIVDRPQDLVLWRNPRRWMRSFPDDGYAKKLAYYNGSFVLHRCGILPQIWEDFDPASEWIKCARDDQWYLSALAGRDWPYWDHTHGIYRIAPEHHTYGIWGELPENARLVTFPGGTGKPWQAETIATHPWIVQHRL